MHAEYYRRRFRHVLVDEYQDTNHAQYALVLRTGQKHSDASRSESRLEPPAELCVVGDADQSIYAFRGATIRNIEEFEGDYRGPDPPRAELPVDPDHPSAANAVIAATRQRIRSACGPIPATAR